MAIVIDNLAAIGIEAEADPRITETYFSELADGACVICRAGWFADYPTYDNFMYDLFHTESLGCNNYGFSNPEFDALVAEAKQTTDPDAAGRSCSSKRSRSCSTSEVGVIPINWYLGDYAFDPDVLAGLHADAGRADPLGADHRHQVTA